MLPRAAGTGCGTHGVRVQGHVCDNMYVVGLTVQLVYHVHAVKYTTRWARALDSERTWYRYSVHIDEVGLNEMYIVDMRCGTPQLK